MSEELRARLFEWGFRLLILGLVSFWLIAPPQPAAPAIPHVLEETGR